MMVSVNVRVMARSEGVCLGGRGMGGSRERAVRRLRRTVRAMTWWVVMQGSRWLCWSDLARSFQRFDHVLSYVVRLVVRSEVTRRLRRE